MSEKPTPTFSWDEIDALRRQSLPDIDPGEGWFSRRDYAERYSLSRWSVAAQLKQLVSQGVLEQRECVIQGKRKTMFRQVKEAVHASSPRQR